MCGRFALFAYMRQLMEEFGIDEAEAVEAGQRYNVAPTQRVLAVVSDGETNHLEEFRWGLVPHWAKGDRPRYMINARAETVAEKPMFQNAFKHRRCLVLADGFYEWRKSGKVKVPMFIRDVTGRPWGFAGIYETWNSPDGDEVTTCAIITTGANRLMSTIHDRMPAIVREEDRATWLDPSVNDPGVLLPMLRPYEDDRMEAFPVSDEVNSPRNDHPGLVRPSGSPLDDLV